MSLFYRTFGALNAPYYFRHLFFGALLASLLVVPAMYRGESNYLPLVGLCLVNTLLYPYARFVYESIMGFLLGRNVFMVPGAWFFIGKMAAMIVCWGAAVLIAPFGLLYLAYATRPQAPVAGEHLG